MLGAFRGTHRLGRAITVATCCLLLGVYPGIVTAQILKYDNENEVLMAGTVSPTSLQSVLERLIEKCSAYGDNVRVSGEAALSNWQTRHSAYLEENRKIRALVEQSLRQNPKASEMFHDLLYVQTPVVLDKQYESFAAPIDMMKTVPAKASICNSYIQAIDEKRFDLKNNDPTLAAYLDKRIQARNRAK
ncbi:hypothetical protein [Pandoraea sp. NPDC087047]|uniref:hypothetical protein n=1 Tax=Pandoraea sp. NPDC087047 TaxID=3364390 RepID=UPI003826EA46